MSVVLGKNVIFRLADGLIACGRSCTLITSTSLIETTTVGNGKNAAFRPQKNTTTGSLEGVTFLNMSGRITLPYLRKYQLEHTLCQGRYERQDEDGYEYTDVFSFYISNISESGAAGDFATFQMDIQVNGSPKGMIGETGYLLTNTGVIILDNNGQPIITQALTTLYQ